MQQSDIAAFGRVGEQQGQQEDSQRTVRPFGILLICGIQILKCVVLLLTAILLQVKPELVTGPDSLLYPLLYLATRGRYDSMTAALAGGSVLPGLILFLGAYSGMIAMGLFRLNAWARRTLMLSCGLTIVLFAKSRLLPDAAAAASPNMTNVYVLLAIDAWAFLYLLRGETAELFPAKK